MIDRLWPAAQRDTNLDVYALLDGARDGSVVSLLQDSDLPSVCLFSEPLTTSLRAAAPHLVRLGPAAALTRHLLEAGWGNHWIVLLKVRHDLPLPQLTRHLRSLLRVREETGQILMFRFYDPRVLRIYLPTCSVGEAAAVFGPILEFICDDAVASHSLKFSRDESGIARASSW